jgi:hypothetical protein
LKCSRPSNAWNHQFPGVFFSLITKYNVHKRNLYPGKVSLIFSRRLLEQQNYHYNPSDINGIITPLTLFSWNLEDADFRKESIHFIRNELVFHNDVDLIYLCKVIEGAKFNLPKKILDNDEKPN